MQTRTNTPIGKTLIMVLLTSLVMWTTLPASPALAKGRTIPANSGIPAGLLTSDGRLNLTTGFSGTLDLRGWEVKLRRLVGPGKWDERMGVGHRHQW